MTDNSMAVLTLLWQWGDCGFLREPIQLMRHRLPPGKWARQSLGQRHSQRITVWRHYLVALFAVFVIAPILAAEGDLQSPKKPFTITLLVAGSPDVAFSGICWLKSERGEEKYEISGVGPYSQEFIGFGVTCRVSKDSAGGVLTIELRKDSSLISRSSTTALRGLISIAVQ